MKKILVLILVLLFAITLFACEKHIVTPPDDTKILDPLPDLIDYSTKASYYNVTTLSYDSAVRNKAEADLKVKQDEENAKKDEWDDDTTTFTKIFCSADVEGIVDRFAMAALPQNRMVALVEYITREDDDNAQGYGLTKGTTSAIQDYEDIDHLYELYDDDIERENDDDEKTVYENLQLKKRKVMAELIAIFGDDGDQAARVAMEQLCYAQEVVDTIMIPTYNAANIGADYEFDDYFKEVFFDYEALVYFKAFNKTISSNEMLTGNYTAADKKEIVKLYGFHYQYEKKDYMCFDDATYERYLELDQMDYYENNADALEYARLDRIHYANAYRYSDTFYVKYYQTQLTFQQKQEDFDKSVYEISPASATDTSLSYSGEMRKGLNKGLTSNLLISDINYEYTGVNANVTRYNTKNTAYNRLSDDDQKSNENKLKKVELEVEQLKSQYYMMTHRLMTNKDLTQALQYQIYSYSADYLRGIQSYKKEGVTLNAELRRLDTNAPDYLQKKAEKEDKIGRNEAMLINVQNNYSTSNPTGTSGQVSKAENITWDAIEEEVKTAIGNDDTYSNFHNERINGIERWRDRTAQQVDEYFENILIKRYWKKGNETRDITDSEPSEAKGWEKVYKEDHNISRMMNTHETVFRYMYGQIKVTYKKAEFTLYSIKEDTDNNNNVSPSFTQKTTYAVTDTTGSGILVGTLKAQNKMSKMPNPTQCINFMTETVDSGDAPTLAFWQGGSSGTWSSTYYVDTRSKPMKAESREEKVGNVTYVYYYEFAGWYVDTDLKYRALQGEEYDYDITLYPGYYITKVVKP